MTSVSTVETTLVTEGVRGVEEKPNLVGGSTGASDPRLFPARVPEAVSMRCRSTGLYHARRPERPVPRVCTPRMTAEATGCEHCLTAWQLIEQRRTARRELGLAKLAIRNIGKAELKRPPALEDLAS